MEASNTTCIQQIQSVSSMEASRFYFNQMSLAIRILIWLMFRDYLSAHS